MEELIQEPAGSWIGYETSAYGGSTESGEVKWIPKKFYRCSKCRKGTAVRTPYCPYCGQKMILQDEAGRRRKD